MRISENGWYWSQELGLYLGIWENRLRYFTVAGRLVLTPEEANLEEIRKAETERQRAETERQRAETERQRAETEMQRAETERERANKLAEYLRSLGVDPDSVVN
jgi:hypothetical protein